MERRLADLNGVIEAVASKKPVRVLTHPALGLGALLSHSEWDSQRAAQVLTRFPVGELTALSRFYGHEDDIRRWFAEEDTAWSHLRVLEGRPGRLKNEDIAVLRTALQSAWSLNFLVVFNARKGVASAEKVGVRPAAVAGMAERRICEPLSTGVSPLPLGHM